LRRHVVDRLLDAVRNSPHGAPADAAAMGVDQEEWDRVVSGQSHPDLSLLLRVAHATGSPVERLLAPYSPAAARRRAAAGAAGETAATDAYVEDLARDVALLVEAKTLKPPRVAPPAGGSAPAEAERLALWARRAVSAGYEPLRDVQDAAAQLGLYIFVVPMPPGAAEATYLRAPEARCGVAWIARRPAPESGRVRFTAAHELGHHLAGDDYRAETSEQDRGEAFANLFAIFFLMPRAGAEEVFAGARADGPAAVRLAAMTASARYGVSWSASCWHLYNLGLLTGAEKDALQGRGPTGPELHGAGLWVDVLPDRVAPSQVTEAAVRAYRRRKISAAKCRQIAHSPDMELPRPDRLPPAVHASHLRPSWLDAGPCD
jgi:Zn-dependent peptidase ImmA (M78 family)